MAYSNLRWGDDEAQTLARAFAYAHAKGRWTVEVSWRTTAWAPALKLTSLQPNLGRGALGST